MTDELKYYKVYLSHLDNRMVKCGCGKKDCKIGLNFDGGDGKEIMLLTTKYGNEHGMHLTEENIDETIERLLEAKNCIKNNKQ
jgi:hypothetical protein